MLEIKNTRLPPMADMKQLQKAYDILENTVDARKQKESTESDTTSSEE